jgi:hypothetical protein
MKDRMEIPNCPNCGGESNGDVLYSSPLQTRCVKCLRVYTFGFGIEVIDGDEGRARRSGMCDAKSERERIVLWLREWAMSPGSTFAAQQSILEYAAAIENGKHWTDKIKLEKFYHGKK